MAIMKGKKIVNAFVCEIIDNKDGEKKEEGTTKKKKTPKKPKQVKKSENVVIESSKKEGTGANEKTEKKKFNKNIKKQPKKKSFYQKYVQKKIDQGQTALPQKVENKIYKLKVALRKKGLSPDEIKDIIRKKRREEELKHRKTLKDLCFHCRKTGHHFSECSQNVGEANGAEICYFCGSTEHRLHECSGYKNANKSKKEVNLPFAKCFICNEMGHLTRSCTSNTKGVFPKGGECRVCGSINHRAKDCPDEEKERENEILLPTIDNLSGGVDADDFEISAPKTKVNKVVHSKF